MFYTSNICESYNRTLNLRFVATYKTILNFERLIKEIIEKYENRNIYQEWYISLTRALQFYVNNKTDSIELIDNSDLKEIKNKYLNYLNGNHISINDWIILLKMKITIIKRKN